MSQLQWRPASAGLSLQSVRPPRGRTFSGQSSELFLHKGTSLHDLDQFFVIRTCKGPEKRTGEKFRSGTNKRSVAYTAVEHAHEFHRLQSLTERCASNAKLLAELTLGREAVSSLPGSLDHIFDELLEGGLGKRRTR